MIEAARQSGMSVGEWLRVVLQEDHSASEEHNTAPAEPADPVARLEQRLAAMERASREAFDRLNERLGATAPAPAPVKRPTRSSSTVREMVAALAHELDNSDESARSEIEGKRVAARPAPELASVPVDEADSAIRELERRILLGEAAAAAPRAPEPEIDPTEARLAEISERLNALMAAQAPQPQPVRARAPKPKPAAGIDQALRGLEARIDAVRSRAAAPAPAPNDRIARIEAKLAELGSRVASPAARPATDTAARDPMAGALDEIARRQRMLDEPATGEETRRDGVSASLAALRGEVASLVQQIGAIGRKGAADEGGYYELARRIDALAAREPQTHSQLETLRGELHGMLDEFVRDARHDRARLDALGEEVSDLRRALESQNDHAALTRLETRVGELTRSVETVATAMAEPVDHRFAQLEARIESVADQIARLAGQTTGADAFDELKAEIAAIRDDLAVRPQADTGRLEAQIQDLAGRIEQFAGRDTDSAALDELETRVARLAADLENGQPGGDMLQRVERSLADVQSQLASTEQSSIEAARQAALQAVQDLSAHGVESDLIRDLRNDLESLRAAATDAPTAPGQVNETISHIVDRLARLETQAGEAPAGTAGDAHEPLVPRAAIAPAFGHRAETGEAMTAEAAPAAGDELPKSSRERRADFIAAARRAAQAAAAESRDAEEAAAREHIEDDIDEDGEEREGPFRRISKAIRGRKRSVLLAAAAIVIAVGAMQIYGDIDPKPAADKLISRAVATPAPAVTKPAPREDVADASAMAPAPGHVGPAMVAPGPADDLAFAAPSGIGARFVKAPPNTGATATFSNAGQPPIPGAANIDPSIGSAELIAAAQKGDAAAAFEIGSRYADGVRVDKNLALARTWYEKAAKGGLAVAQYRLGSLYERGLGGERDLVAAADWYQRAADQGNINAMHNLAVLMSEGVDGQPDHTKALQWFVAAANYGIKDSQYNLGVLYARGIGPEQDLVQSYKWFAIAAAAGDKDAAERRDEVGGLLSPEDLALARAALQGWTKKQPIVEANSVAGTWSDTSMVGAADQKAIVQKIQALLSHRGYDPGPSDGVAGPKTREAVIAFQAENGYEMTGRIDGTLVAALSSPTN